MSDAPEFLSRRAFVWACRLDVQTLKPGNVSEASEGHGMRAAQFIRSATAAAPPLCAPGAAVGERIEGAIRATRQRVDCNTNLGIVLLCAPIVAAREWWRPSARLGGLRTALADVLAALDIADARAAYRAIALAQPAGLGTAPDQDVSSLPSVGLRDAMALAAGRDRIAAQYEHAYADVFDPGLAAFGESFAHAHRIGQEPGVAAQAAMLRAFLEFLAAYPDSHIVRKHGPALAHSVMVEAGSWRDRARSGDLAQADRGLAEWDVSLKRRGLNPGTSADLCVATALVAALLYPTLAEPLAD